MLFFQDRLDAAQRLAKRLGEYRSAAPLVLALPPGGVPIAGLVADRLGAELDVLVARRVYLLRPDAAVGALTEGGTLLLDERRLTGLALAPRALSRLALEAAREVHREVRRLRGERPLTDPQGRTVIVVDEGAARGLLALAALEDLRRRHAGRVVLALPVAASRAAARLRAAVDELVCLDAPSAFAGVGAAYLELAEVTDQQIRQVLDRIGSGASWN